MSKHKLPAVKHALQVLRAAGGGPLTMEEVAALEACAVSQSELLEALRSASTLLEEGTSQSSVDEAARVIRAAIAKAEGK